MYHLDTISTMDNPQIEFMMDERAIRALHSAVCFTLDKWTGQEDIDQETLFMLKPFLQGSIFEFDFNRVE